MYRASRIPRRPSRSRYLPPEARDYWRFRPLLQDLSGRMFRMVSPEDLRAAEEALGNVDPADDPATAVLMDSCIYDWPDREGRSVVARYAETVPGKRLPDLEREVLDAMLRPRYAHFRVEEVLPGIGARVWSALDQKEFTLVEPLLDGVPGGKGQWWLSRLIFPAGRCMTTGAPTLLGRSTSEGPDEELARLGSALQRECSAREIAVIFAAWAIWAHTRHGGSEDDAWSPADGPAK